MDLTLIEPKNQVLHPENCLEVKRYSHQSAYQFLEDYDGDVPDTICPLCRRNITEELSAYAPVARSVAVDALHADNETERKAALDALRHLITRSGECLRNAGYLKENVGVSVKSRSDWKQKRREATDTDQFDRLLMDALEVCFAFDIAYYIPAGSESWDQLLNAASNGDFGLQCEKNVAESIQWLSKYQEPTTESEVTDLLRSFSKETEGGRSDENSGRTASDATPSPSSTSEPSSEDATSAATATTLGEF